MFLLFKNSVDLNSYFLRYHFCQIAPTPLCQRGDWIFGELNIYVLL
ncbi:hypothetical protein HMPREF9095_0734 [Haemophilus aegyptius ATCC 11116]|nr:hypothetical protein HMPREF9095_0734 [Haemophilus aegyptius ATCC 11116]